MTIVALKSYQHPLSADNILYFMRTNLISNTHLNYQTSGKEVSRYKGGVN